MSWIFKISWIKNILFLLNQFWSSKYFANKCVKLLLKMSKPLCHGHYHKLRRNMQLAGSPFKKRKNNIGLRFVEILHYRWKQKKIFKGNLFVHIYSALIKPFGEKFRVVTDKLLNTYFTLLEMTKSSLKWIVYVIADISRWKGCVYPFRIFHISFLGKTCTIQNNILCMILSIF